MPLHQYKKYAKRAEKHRQENLHKAHKDLEKAEQDFKLRLDEKKKSKSETEPFDEKAYIFDSARAYSWALENEKPPPSACVGRRDTSEARRLAKMADQLTDETVALSGLSLWTAMAGLLSKVDTSGGSALGKSKGDSSLQETNSPSRTDRLFGRNK